jgi:cold shock CspA family protein
MEYQGTVKFYDPNKAYGFISGAPEGDVFIHRSNLAPGREELVEGQEVVFKTRSAARGAEAYDVIVVRESHLPPRPRAARESGGGRDRFGGGRDSRDSGRLPRRSETGRVPSGPVLGEIRSIDANGRFMFVKSERDDLDVFVHSSFFTGMGLRRGDRVSITVEQGPKGLRASSLEPA